MLKYISIFISVGLIVCQSERLKGQINEMNAVKEEILAKTNKKENRQTWMKEEIFINLIDEMGGFIVYNFAFL